MADQPPVDGGLDSAFFREALRQCREAIVITDARLDPPGPTILFINDAFERLTGYHATEIVGASPRILQGPGTDPAVLRQLREQLARGEDFLGTTLNYRRDGGEFYLEWSIRAIRDENGDITHYISLQRDVTAQMREKQAAEATAREQERRIHALTLLHRAAFLLHQTGGDRHEILERFAILVPGCLHNPDAVSARIRIDDAEYRAPGFVEQGFLHSVKIETPLGTRAAIEVFHRPLALDERERPLGRDEVGLIESLAELLRLYLYREEYVEQSRLHREALAHVDRLSLLGGMATGLAHELNQPLTAISSFAEAALERLRGGEPDGEAPTKTLQQIVRQSERAGHIVAEVRQFARKDSDLRTRITVEQLLEEIQDLMALDADRAGVKLSQQIADGLPELDVDPVQVQQVVLNLVRNAVHAVEESGGSDRRVVLAARADPGGVVFAVRDSGPGISEGEGERILAPFFTTKADGLGLGLPISVSIVENHGGELWQEEAPEGGAAFLFRLPADSSRLPHEEQ